MKMILWTGTIAFWSSLLSLIAVSPTLSMQPENAIEERDRLQDAIRQEIDNVLGLAGLNKIEMPPFVSEELQGYRQSQQNQNIAPFLGYWVREWELFPPYSSVSIFPSEIENQICIIEEIYDYGEYYNLDRQVRSAQFELVLVERGEAIGNEFILDRDLISIEDNPLGEEKIEFLGRVNSLTREFESLYASSGIATDEFLNPDIKQQFDAHACLDSRSVAR